MRDDAPTRWTPLKIFGSLCLAWAFLKMAVIGFYPDELVLQVIVPLAVGFVLLAIDKRSVRGGG